MRRALGKGLSQLIGETQAEYGINELPISAIAPNPNQPRRYFEPEKIEELAASIREVGIISPLMVRPLADGRYELIAGERRWRAAQAAGLTHVPVTVRSADSRLTLELALIENLQREDITAMEAARAYRQLLDDFEISQEEVARRVGKSRAAVTNTLRLLRLPAAVQQSVESGELTEGQVRPLLSLESEAEQLAIFDQIRKQKLSARDIEAAVKRRQGDSPKARKKRGVIDPSDANWRALQEAASEKLGSPVKLEGSERGGFIRIQFFGEDDLVRIMDQLGIEL